MMEVAGRLPLLPRPPRYRLSRQPCGDVVWWDEWETIPNEHTNVRFATEPEIRIIMRLVVLAMGGRRVPQRLRDELQRMTMEFSDG